MKNQLLILWTILLTVNFSFAQPQWKFHIAFEDATGAKDTIWCIWDTAATDGQLNSVDTAFGEAGVTFDYNLFNVWIYNNVPFPYTDSTKTSAIPFNGAFSLEIRAFNYQYPITVSWDSSLFHAPGLPLPVGYVNRAVMDNDYFFLVNNDPPLQRFNMLLDNSVIAPSFWWGSQSQFPLIIGIMRDETIGINEMDMGKKTLTVYPNPANEYLIIKSNEPLRKVIFWNSMMKNVIEIDSISQINTSHLPEGIYILEITNNLNLKQYEKVVILH
jgi:hypothetical protein